MSISAKVQSYLEWPGVKRALGVELSATRAKHAWEAWESLLLNDEAIFKSNELRATKIKSTAILVH